MKRMAQKGLTLIEMVIAISLLALMISAIVFSFDGAKSRAQVLVSAMSEYASALERMKTDTSCYPVKLGALFDVTQVELNTDSHCGAVLAKQWNGPYVKAAQTANAGLQVTLPGISPDLTIELVKGNAGSGTRPTFKWFIVARGVPSEIATHAVTVCNGVETLVGEAFTGQPKCAGGVHYALQTNWGITGGTAIIATPTPGALQEVAYMFNESRQ